jgi:hypothetical protein
MSQRFHFSFLSTFMGNPDYEVYDRQTKESHRLSVKGETGAASYLGEPVPVEVLAAFNAWRRQEHDAAVAQITAKYGEAEAQQIAPFREAVAA